MNKKITNKTDTHPPKATAIGPKTTGRRVESLPDIRLAEFFRENGLPKVASLIDDLEQIAAT